MLLDKLETASLAELEQTLAQPGIAVNQVIDMITVRGLECSSLDEGLHAAVLLKEHQRFPEAEKIFQRLMSQWPKEERLAYEHIQLLRRLRQDTLADSMVLDLIQQGGAGPNILREFLVRGLVELEPGGTRDSFLALLAKVVQAANSPYVTALASYLSSFSATDALAKLRQSKVQTFEAIRERCLSAVRARTPFCMLRLGDGEGAFLHPSSREASHEPLFFEHRLFFTNRWYDDPDLASDPEFLAVADELRRRLFEADLVGAPLAEWLEHEISHRNLRSIVCCMELCRLSAEIGVASLDRLTTTTIAVDMEYRGWISELLAEAKSVSLITSHPDLARRLEASGRARVRRTMLIPPANSDRGQTGYEKRGSHFRDAFPGIMRDIDAIVPGEVVLIGAGFLGKLYALKVKGRGGIAIDVGSLLDLWMGFVTRPGFVRLDHMVLDRN